MTNDPQDLDMPRLHWLMQMLQTVDVGLVVVDRAFDIQLWNGFMENHSGVRTSQARGNNIFSLFPELPDQWLTRKIESVFTLDSRAYSTWGQRPHLFRFKSYRPLTGRSEQMYQNVTIIPLTGMDKRVTHACILIYDVTDIATSKIELEKANQELARLSRTDRLTGLNNRGHWEERLSQEFRRFRRSQTPSSLVMFDIDHFKKVNDTFGHQAGDEVIKQVASTLLSLQRETDISGRYGGEEFGVILPETNAEQASIMSERLRVSLEEAEVEYEGQHISFTVSLGVCEITPDMTEYSQWLERADQALYHSKRNGRNQTTVHST
ncbi:GGDEF domain-containing protein [Oceanospirillum linum]|uniref:diguanylate cyclase n=1 Tax=Oceanospirillum linum TaxID=966 RepID=A0A1T1HDH5_OCELI|nr:diguanylate cyclase [Oceanospirillum linum]OOV87908.1 diguanylate cyclase [Oceanospirillum linum]SEG50902.1 PAS domain S-box-containing protein/diguanylate cyclase (GGDEF) domain-containing protein [Oleiphilus messinensis]SMP35307.1 diguanylate cyclase [Oceanospirillum linum]